MALPPVADVAEFLTLVRLCRRFQGISAEGVAMDYALSEQQQAFQAAAERFAKQKLAPHYQGHAKENRIDRALMKEMGGLGLIGVDLPEKYGGLSESSATSGVIIEQIAYGDFNASYVQLLAS